MRIKLLVLTLFTLFIGVRSVFAEFTFTVPNTTITSDDEIETTVTLSLHGQDDKNYYLEGAFQKGTSNYFGLTWNDSSWTQYTSSDFTMLKQITTDSTGNWTGIVKVKIDQNSSLFSGSGTYTLKVRRFTTGGSKYWTDNSINLIVNSSSSTPSPTPLPTSTPQPTPSSTLSQTTTSASSKPKSTSTPKTSASSTNPSPVPTQITSTPIPTKLAIKVEYKAASIAGITSAPTPLEEVKIKSQKQTNLLVWAGIILIFAGSFLVGYIYLKRNANTHIKLRRRY